MGTPNNNISNVRQKAADDEVPRDRNDAFITMTEPRLMFQQSRPKHVLSGLSSGAGYVVAGVVSACGIIVLAPAVGARTGYYYSRCPVVVGDDDDDNNNTYYRCSVAGGAVGAVVGTVLGVANAASVVAGGAIAGLGQAVRGIASTPEAIVQPGRGRWWNPNEGCWVRTHLGSEAEWVASLPEHDEDILGDRAIPEHIRNERRHAADSVFQRNAPDAAAAAVFLVKETYLYDLLGVPPNADTETIRRRYNQIQRKFQPTRAGCVGSTEAQEKFASINRAYYVLTDEQMRGRYDRFGMNVFQALSESESASEEDNNDNNDNDNDNDNEPLVDPLEFCSILYGSEQFDHFIGRPAGACNAYFGETISSKINAVQARVIQKRRVTRLALLLAERLKMWIRQEESRPHVKAVVEKQWLDEAKRLCDNSYGWQLVHLIGLTYSQSACMFLGSFESGIGPPTFQMWSRRQEINWTRTKHIASVKLATSFTGDRERFSLEKRASTRLSSSLSEQHQLIQARQLYKEIGSNVLDLLWKQMSFDVITTIHEAASMVLFDQDLNRETRRLRGEGLEALGAVFQSAARNHEPNRETTKDEIKCREIAFYALLDTICRKQQQQQQQQQQHNAAAAASSSSSKSWRSSSSCSGSSSSRPVNGKMMFPIVYVSNGDDDNPRVLSCVRRVVRKQQRAPPAA